LFKDWLWVREGLFLVDVEGLVFGVTSTALRRGFLPLIPLTRMTCTTLQGRKMIMKKMILAWSWRSGKMLIMKMILAWSWRSGKPNGDPGLAWPGLVLVVLDLIRLALARPSALARSRLRKETES
jgi:hypothetical protein